MAEKTAPKLTSPQRSLLKDLLRNGPQYVSDSYRPGQKLLELGLARKAEEMIAGSILMATEAAHALEARR